jgi:2-haloacid dehalogenase
MGAAKPVAIVFDTFGTVVDWRSSLIAELSEFGRQKGVSADWSELVDRWRAAYHPSMDRVRKGEIPWTKLDDLHRASLDELIEEFGIKGFTKADLQHINRGWHRLNPWPDAVAGLRRLKSRYIIGPLSNGNLALLTNMAKHAKIPWDVIFGSDLFGHYKPDPETYLGVARLLDLEARSGDDGRSAQRRPGQRTQMRADDCILPPP